MSDVACVSFVNTFCVCACVCVQMSLCGCCVVYSVMLYGLFGACCLVLVCVCVCWCACVRVFRFLIYCVMLYDVLFVCGCGVCVFVCGYVNMFVCFIRDVLCDVV